VRSYPRLQSHLRALAQCRRCPEVLAPPVFGLPVRSRVMLIGQAPGPREREQLRPFAWTAGRRLFGWFESIGLPERAFRSGVYMSAVARCFPGKRPGGGDRPPSRAEMANCRRWLEAEIEILAPRLLLPVGGLAITALLGPRKLAEAVGTVHHLALGAGTADVIPLPHPSGASTWIHGEPGKTLLRRALRALREHAEWQRLLSSRR